MPSGGGRQSRGGRRGEDGGRRLRASVFHPVHLVASATHCHGPLGDLRRGRGGGEGGGRADKSVLSEGTCLWLISGERGREVGREKGVGDCGGEERVWELGGQRGVGMGERKWGER